MYKRNVWLSVFICVCVYNIVSKPFDVTILESNSRNCTVHTKTVKQHDSAEPCAVCTRRAQCVHLLRLGLGHTIDRQSLQIFVKPLTQNRCKFYTLNAHYNVIYITIKLVHKNVYIEYTFINVSYSLYNVPIAIPYNLYKQFSTMARGYTRCTCVCVCVRVSVFSLSSNLFLLKMILRCIIKKQRYIVSQCIV